MRIITKTQDLESLAEELSGAPYLTVDTEFMRDQSYWPKLCLIQVASPETAAIIDPLANGIKLSAFIALLKNENIVKVFHAARQDIEIFFHIAGTIPKPLFDTQIAAMVCGFGEAASYETLARSLAKVEIDKSARFTDWARRPLTERQLEYALADVTHLRTVYQALLSELTRSDRTGWVEEEIDALMKPSLYRLNPVEAWKRLKPRTSSRKFLAMMATIAEWREREAQQRDLPRSRVLKDETIMEISAHPPDSPQALEQIRSVQKGFATSRLGTSLMEAITRGRTARPPEQVAAEQRRRKKEPSPGAIDLLKTLLRLRAERARVAPRLIASADDIEKLAAYEDEKLPALHGWRAEVFGHDAVALRDGKLAVTLEKGEAVVVELDD
jgi:ribonuclease D